jgi:hypothetical protein
MSGQVVGKLKQILKRKCVEKAAAAAAVDVDRFKN